MRQRTKRSTGAGRALVAAASHQGGSTAAALADFFRAAASSCSVKSITNFTKGVAAMTFVQGGGGIGGGGGGVYVTGGGTTKLTRQKLNTPATGPCTLQSLSPSSARAHRRPRLPPWPRGPRRSATSTGRSSQKSPTCRDGKARGTEVAAWTWEVEGTQNAVKGAAFKEWGLCLKVSSGSRAGGRG